MFINREFPFVLALAFFASVFSTFLWLIYMFMYLKDKLGGMSFGSLGLSDISLYIALLVLPVLVLWMIFGYVTQYLNFHRLNDNMYSLFKQMKKNLEYTDLIARIMLEAEQNGKDGFILNKFDLFITDMNELLAEIIQRGALAAPEQIDSLWAKTRNGAKWAFGKVIIEIDANQGNFGSRLVLKAQNDKVLAGTILEFCARYQNLLGILEKHDKERIFLTMVETGVYGKVYSILAPWGEQIRRKRDFGDLREENEETSLEPRRFSGLSASAPATEERDLYAANSDLSTKTLLLPPFRKRKTATVNRLWICSIRLSTAAGPKKNRKRTATEIPFQWLWNAVSARRKPTVNRKRRLLTCDMTTTPCRRRLSPAVKKKETTRKEAALPKKGNQPSKT